MNNEDKENTENNSQCKCGCKDSASNNEQCQCSENADTQCDSMQGYETSAECAADSMCDEEHNMNIADLETKLEKATQDAEKNKDLYIRTVADFDTYRRKIQREKQELSKFAMQPIIEEILPSIDHLDMAIVAAKNSDDSKNILMGVEMVCMQLKKVLSNFGVEEVLAEGKDFDPNTSECVSHQPSDDVAENIVMQVIRKGYTFNGRLLRAATVVVSSGKA